MLVLERRRYSMQNSRSNCFVITSLNSLYGVNGKKNEYLIFENYSWLCLWSMVIFCFIAFFFLGGQLVLVIIINIKMYSWIYVDNKSITRCMCIRNNQTILWDQMVISVVCLDSNYSTWMQWSFLFYYSEWWYRCLFVFFFLSN